MENNYLKQIDSVNSMCYPESPKVTNYCKSFETLLCLTFETTQGTFTKVAKWVQNSPHIRVLVISLIVISREKQNLNEFICDARRIVYYCATTTLVQLLRYNYCGTVVYIMVFCGIVPTYDAPLWRHFACIFEKKNVTTLSDLFEFFN